MSDMRPTDRRTVVKRRIVEILSYHKGGISSNRISYEVAREYKLGTFEEEVHEYLRELEREGSVEKVKKTLPDEFVWYVEKGSSHSVEVWRLTRTERARLSQTAFESGASVQPTE